MEVPPRTSNKFEEQKLIASDVPSQKDERASSKKDLPLQSL